MYLLIIWLPLVSAILAGLFGRKIGSRGVGILTSNCIVGSWLISCGILYEVVLNQSVTYIKGGRWIDLEVLTVSFGLQFDSMTSLMLILITGVSALVHIYSIGYMEGDPHIPRFMSYLSLFTFLMIILVTSDNYMQLFIGWEGVGLCSYLLINFWFSRMQANKAAIKAMLVNRVGDMGLVIGIILLVRKYGTLDFAIINGLCTQVKDFGYIGTPMLQDWSIRDTTVICILLLIGAVGKSAQLGLHMWLPDAMEGPTPVSALIHAATMVTAGVFLIMRSGALFEGSALAMSIVTIWGALTAFFAATIGLVQNDIKKVIAYSTCSQLGYMLMSCGISNYSASLYHLINHGFFKALLFLSAGAVIHAIGEEQDMRRMGGLNKFLPYTYSVMVVGSLSLMGAPYMAGFYSKDLILELLYGERHIVFAYWLGCFSAFLTAYYSVRVICLVFWTRMANTKIVNPRYQNGISRYCMKNSNFSMLNRDSGCINTQKDFGYCNIQNRTDLKHAQANAQMGISKSDRKDEYIELWVRDPRWTMTVPLAILAFGSIFVGYWGKEVLVSNILPPILVDEVKRVPLLFSLLGAGWAYIRIDGYLRMYRVLRRWFTYDRNKGDVESCFQLNTRRALDWLESPVIINCWKLMNRVKIICGVLVFQFLDFLARNDFGYCNIQNRFVWRIILLHQFRGFIKADKDFGYCNIQNRTDLTQVNNRMISRKVSFHSSLVEGVYAFMGSAWQFNYIINHMGVKNMLKFGHLVTYRIIDRGLLEQIGPAGIQKGVIKLMQGMSNLQSGLIFNYVLFLIIFTSLFILGSGYGIMGM